MKGNTRKANDSSLKQHAAGAGAKQSASQSVGENADLVMEESASDADEDRVRNELQELGEDREPGSEEQQEEQPEEDGKYLHVELGISDERNQEIADLVNVEADKQRGNGKGFDIAQLLKDIQHIPQDTNEAVYMGFVAANAWNAMRNPLAGLMRMFGGR